MRGGSSLITILIIIIKIIIIILIILVITLIILIIILFIVYPSFALLLMSSPLHKTSLGGRGGKFSRSSG
jgi:hypothetical protein